ncbi:hypothetical protein KCU92_g7420, partial [Aureobasidium melanogenum]|jgi:hypothetical protein
MATKNIKNDQLATNMEKSTTNNFWSSCSWIIKITMKLLPWLMLMHNLLYVIFPNSSNGKTDINLAWTNLSSIIYLIGMQAWIDGGIIEV